MRMAWSSRMYGIAPERMSLRSVRSHTPRDRAASRGRRVRRWRLGAWVGVLANGRPTFPRGAFQAFKHGTQPIPERAAAQSDGLYPSLSSPPKDGFSSDPEAVRKLPCGEQAFGLPMCVNGHTPARVDRARVDGTRFWPIGTRRNSVGIPNGTSLSRPALHAATETRGRYSGWDSASPLASGHPSVFGILAHALPRCRRLPEPAHSDKRGTFRILE